jgi:hypothetical protein
MPVPRSRRCRVAAAIAVAGIAVGAGTASASVPHTVVPGETLWSIAAANNFTTRTIAVFNGRSETSPVYAGETIQIPTESEGAAALANAGLLGSSSSSTTTSSGSATGPPPPDPPYWTSPIYCPSCTGGQAYLASNAAYNWNLMRDQALSLYGTDMYPAGDLSAYRSYGQQLYLYNLYLSGQGSLAAPPGTSSHEYGTAIDVADPAMASVIDQIGASYGWAKIEAPGEWWHINYVGP